MFQLYLNGKFLENLTLDPKKLPKTIEEAATLYECLQYADSLKVCPGPVNCSK